MELVYVPVPAGSYTEAAAVAADNIAAEAAVVVAADNSAEAAAALAGLENTRSGHPATEFQPDPATCFRNRRRIY